MQCTLYTLPEKQPSTEKDEVFSQNWVKGGKKKGSWEGVQYFQNFYYFQPFHTVSVACGLLFDCILSGAETIRGISQDVGAPVRRNPACCTRPESQVLVAATAPDQFNPHQIPTLPPFNVIHRRRSRDILLL